MVIKLKMSSHHLQRINAPNDKSHRILRYVLKIGDMEEAVSVFVDLLKMHVLSHHEFEKGSADGEDVHYEGPWSRTLVGYSNTAENTEICLQLTVAHGIGKYERGNHLHSVEVQVGNERSLIEAGLQKETIRGHEMYVVGCDGYRIEIMKSPDGKSRISRIILACDTSIFPAGRVTRFWTDCLGFEISSWSCTMTPDEEYELQEYFSELQQETSCSCCGCCHAPLQKKLLKCSKPLEDGEVDYVEMQYGSSRDFHLRLQMLPEGQERKDGGSRERFMLTGTPAHLEQVTEMVHTVGRQQGGTKTRLEFQFVPDKDTLHGEVINDPGGLEVCYFGDDEVRKFGNEIQKDAEDYLRICLVEARKKRFGERESTIRFHVFGRHSI